MTSNKVGTRYQRWVENRHNNCGTNSTELDTFQLSCNNWPNINKLTLNLSKTYFLDFSKIKDNIF